MEGCRQLKLLGFKVGGYAQVSMNLVDFEKTNFDEAYRAMKKKPQDSRLE